MPRHPRLQGDDLQQAVVDAARCRASRHHRFEPILGNPDRRPAFGSLITYRCDLCGTVRYDTISRLTGDVLGRSYDHPHWYRDANDDKHAPAWWRATYWDTLPREMILDAAPATQPGLAKLPVKRASRRAAARATKSR